jgi:hypothetical protein
MPDPAAVVAARKAHLAEASDRDTVPAIVSNNLAHLAHLHARARGKPQDLAFSATNPKSVDALRRGYTATGLLDAMTASSLALADGAPFPPATTTPPPSRTHAATPPNPPSAARGPNPSLPQRSGVSTRPPPPR